MTELFPSYWLLLIPASLIIIFIVISIIFSILKLKFGAKETSIVSSTAGATILSLINICSVCLAPTFALFGIFLNFPNVIVTFLFGVSAVSLSNIIIEKWQKDFPFKEFIVMTLMVALSLALLYLIYLIPNVVAETHGHFTPENENIHIHADLKVFITDEFGQEKELNIYTPENMEKNSLFHFHDGKDQENVIHFEGKKGTLADFLETINISSLDECFKRQYEKGEILYYFYVNGEPKNFDYTKYLINDLDKLLLKCGSEPTQEQINFINNFACIQSKKC